MKYVFFLVILSILAICIFTFPVFGLEVNQTYLVCPEDNIGDTALKESIKWQTEDFYVYKIDKSEILTAQFIPKGKIIREYITDKNNNIEMNNPFMQSIDSGEKRIYGVPYIID